MTDCSSPPSSRVLHTYSPEFGGLLKASEETRWESERQLAERLGSVVDRVKNIVELERSAVATNSLKEQREKYAELLTQAKKLEAEAGEDNDIINRDAELVAACEAILRAEKQVKEDTYLISTYYDERQKDLEAKITKLQTDLRAALPEKPGKPI